MAGAPPAGGNRVSPSRLCIVLVNFNGLQDTLKCLRSLEAVRGDGMSLEEAADVRSYVTESAVGWFSATPEEQRWVYDLIGLKGRIYRAESNERGAVKLGRYHWFRIEWTAAIKLVNSTTDVRTTYMAKRATYPAAPNPVPSSRRSK